MRQAGHLHRVWFQVSGVPWPSTWGRRSAAHLLARAAYRNGIKPGLEPVVDEYAAAVTRRKATHIDGEAARRG